MPQVNQGTRSTELHLKSPRTASQHQASPVLDAKLILRVHLLLLLLLQQATGQVAAGAVVFFSSWRRPGGPDVLEIYLATLSSDVLGKKTRLTSVAAQTTLQKERKVTLAGVLRRPTGDGTPAPMAILHPTSHTAPHCLRVAMCTHEVATVRA